MCPRHRLGPLTWGRALPHTTALKRGSQQTSVSRSIFHGHGSQQILVDKNALQLNKLGNLWVQQNENSLFTTGPFRAVSVLVCMGFWVRAHSLFPRVPDRGTLSVRQSDTFGTVPYCLSRLFTERGTVQRSVASFGVVQGNPFCTNENESKPQDINGIKMRLLWLKGDLDTLPGCPFPAARLETLVCCGAQYGSCWL